MHTCRPSGTKFPPYSQYHVESIIVDTILGELKTPVLELLQAYQSEKGCWVVLYYSHSTEIKDNLYYTLWCCEFTTPVVCKHLHVSFMAVLLGLLSDRYDFGLFEIQNKLSGISISHVFVVRWTEEFWERRNKLNFILDSFQYPYFPSSFQINL